MMTPLKKTLWYLVEVTAALITMGDAQQMGDCNIPPGTSSRVKQGQFPIEFIFSDVKSNPDFLLPAGTLRVEEYFFTVDFCFMLLYIKSHLIESNPIPRGTKLAGQTVTCRSLNQSEISATGTILRYLDDVFQKPNDAPNSWYEGDRMVQRIQFYKFPQVPSITIRCGSKNTYPFVGEVEVYADITINKLGCPKSHYGERCEIPCPCENDGYCHTFDGECVCPGEYDGSRCNIYFGPSQSNSSSSNATSDENMSTTIKITDTTYIQSSVKMDLVSKPQAVYDGSSGAVSFLQINNLTNLMVSSVLLSTILSYNIAFDV